MFPYKEGVGERYAGRVEGWVTSVYLTAGRARAGVIFSLDVGLEICDLSPSASL